MNDKGFGRRDLLRTGAGAFTLAGISGLAAGDAEAAEFDPENAEFKTLGPLDITGTELEERLEVVDTARGDPTSAGIGPGAPVFMQYFDASRNRVTAMCTANFVWKDVANDYNNRSNFNGYYLGLAGHCFMPLGSDSYYARRKWASQTAGGDYPARKDPDLEGDGKDGYEGIKVSVCTNCIDGGGSLLFTRPDQKAAGAIKTVELGDVVYAREENDKSDGVESDNAVGFDFGIVEIPAEFEEYVDPSMPVWGGPIKTGRFDDVGTSEVLQYGNGVGAGETIATKNRAGTAAFNFGREGDAPGAYTGSEKMSATYSAWYAALPAAPGDSGSAVQTPRYTGTGPEGYEAAGILTHLAIAAGIRPRPAVGVGTTGGTNVQEAKTMVYEDTRRVLEYDSDEDNSKPSEKGDDPFGRPAEPKPNAPPNGTPYPGEYETDRDIDAYKRYQNEGKEGDDEVNNLEGQAPVLIDDSRLEDAAGYLREDKNITSAIELELVTPGRWNYETGYDD